MTDVLDKVRDHYRSTDLTERLKTALTAFGPGPPPQPNLGVVMGPDMAQLAANLGRNLMEGRLGILTAVFESVN
jgi:hypothetical protein